MNDEYVVVKFADGDQIIAQLLNETQQGVLLLRPITIKLATVMSDGVPVERMMTSVYCPMSDQESFVIDNRHVMFVNRLHPKMIKNYISMSKELYEANRFEAAETQNDKQQEDNLEETRSTTIVYH